MAHTIGDMAHTKEDKADEEAKRDRNFTQRNDDNGWSYPLVFDDSGDTDTQWPTKKKAKMTMNGKKRIFVNQHCLANISPVFARIFFDTNFSDASKSELPMKGKNFDEFLELINCIAMTFKSEQRKPVGMDNLELLLRFADEYEIGSLTTRCVAFIDQLKPTQRKLASGRKILGRLFAICHRTNNLALLPPDIGTKRISRFPFAEIDALDVDEQMQTELLRMKLKRYSRLKCASTKRPKKFGFTSSANCCICGEASTHRCFECRYDASSLFAKLYCSKCYHKHHVPLHSAGAHICPDCLRKFTISTNSEPDMCECVI